MDNESWIKYVGDLLDKVEDNDLPRLGLEEERMIRAVAFYVLPDIESHLKSYIAATTTSAPLPALRPGKDLFAKLRHAATRLPVLEFEVMVHRVVNIVVKNLLQKEIPFLRDFAIECLDLPESVTKQGPAYAMTLKEILTHCCLQTGPFGLAHALDFFLQVKDAQQAIRYGKYWGKRLHETYFMTYNFVHNHLDPTLIEREFRRKVVEMWSVLREEMVEVCQDLGVETTQVICDHFLLGAKEGMLPGTYDLSSCPRDLE